MSCLSVIASSILYLWVTQAFSVSVCVTSGPEVFSSYSSSTMSEAVVPDAMVSPAVGGLYGEKAGSPMLDFSYVGIDAILEQMRRKAMKQGFELNIMVVGKQSLFTLTKIPRFGSHSSCRSHSIAMIKSLAAHTLKEMHVKH